VSTRFGPTDWLHPAGRTRGDIECVTEEGPRGVGTGIHEGGPPSGVPRGATHFGVPILGSPVWCTLGGSPECVPRVETLKRL
jgi:hypothetical protein